MGKNLTFYFFLHFNNRIEKLLYREIKKILKKKWEEFLGG